MTDPIIPAGEWPTKAVMHTWDRSVDGIEGEGYWTSYDEQMGAWVTVRSGLPMPAGHDWRVPVMRPTCKDSLPVAPAIDLERGLRDLYRAYVRLLESGRDRITSLGGGCDPVDVMEQNDIDLRKIRDLPALIDGQALQASPVAQRKLRELQDEGFIVNGFAIFNPTTGRRGLVDYLGYVGWQASQHPDSVLLDSGVIRYPSRNEFGEQCHVIHRGLDLRACIAAGIEESKPSKGEGVADD